MDPDKSVLFVCLGNICRSPIAEAVFNDLLEKRNLKGKWKVDSAAIGPWHAGKLPDARARKIMANHGVQMESLARQINKQDFETFRHILGMDDENQSDLESLAPSEAHKSRVQLVGKWASGGPIQIRDPYYDSGDKGFEDCYRQCVDCLNNFIDQHETKSE